MQEEHAPGGFLLGGARVGRDVVAEFLGDFFVLVLGGGKPGQEIARCRIARSLGRAPVKARRLDFHCLGELTRRVDRERPVEPDRLARNKSFDVLAANERQEVAEFRTIEIEQHVVMAALLLRHPVVHPGGVRIGGAQPVRERAIDMVVFVLAENRERQNFALTQIGKAFHGRNLRS